MRFPIHRRFFLWPGLLLPSVLCLGCGQPVPLTADMPLHLEDHLDAATVVGSEVPADLPQSIEWRFDEPQPDWKIQEPWEPKQGRPEMSRTEDALRIALGAFDVTDDDNDHFGAFIYVDVPDWVRNDWAHIQVRARSEADVDWMVLRVGFNLRDESEWEEDGAFEFWGDVAELIRDGTVQTYNLRADWSGGQWEGPWKQLVLGFIAGNEASIDLLSMTVVPKEATYAGEPAGVRSEVRNRVYRRALYTHTPARVEYRVRIPEAGRLDLGLGVLRQDAPVTFRITAAPAGAEPEPVLEETYDDKENWGQRSVDLSHLAGQTVDLALEAESARPGTVALWAAPTVTGATVPHKPNVIFYVIDGGAADYMSVYGYNRRTTPNLERIAAEGAVFEYAHSNAAWTKPSTASFMTSLQHSVLGGFRNELEALPDSVVTMAQHLHRAGYQTAVFTTNPQAGSLSDLQRGVDVFRDRGMREHSISSVELHRNFWDWRSDYPGTPYWVHFQTTDVHEIHEPVAPFAGLFVLPEARDSLRVLLYDFWDRNWAESCFGWRVSISGYFRQCL